MDPVFKQAEKRKPAQFAFTPNSFIRPETRLTREKRKHCCEESYPIYRLYHTTLSTNSERGQVQMNPSPPLRNHLRLLPPLSRGYYRDRRRRRRRRRRFFRVSLVLLSRAKLVGRSRREVSCFPSLGLRGPIPHPLERRDPSPTWALIK